MTTASQLRKQRERPSSQHRNIAATPFALVAVLVSMVGLAVTMEAATYNIWGAFWLGPVLLLLSVPIANHAARVTNDLRFGRIVMVAAFVKVIGASIARYWVDFSLYGGSDADGYHDSGAELAPLFRSLVYDDLGKISATRFTEIVTGHVYAFTGPTRLGGFMVFSWFAFVGLYLFWRAFCTAVPHGDSKRYAYLIFFFPTILLWTSGTGKDAFMMLCLGTASLGFAKLLTGRVRGIPVLALGLWGAGIVRPHLVLIFLIAALASAPIALVRSRLSTGRASIGPRVALIAVLGLTVVFAVDRAESFFGIDELNVESAESVTTRVEGNTSRSGSVFETQDPGTPQGYARAAVTVLFRPLPFETDNLQGLATALEGVLLLVVGYFSIPRLRLLPKALLNTPYVAWAFTYTAAFIFAFASIGNFGILARQRAQVLPVLFVLLTLEGTGRTDSESEQGEVRKTLSNPVTRHSGL